MGNLCVSKMTPILLDNHGWGLSKFWVKSAPREEGRNDAENGESLAAIRVRNMESPDGDRLPNIPPEF